MNYKLCIKSIYKKFLKLQKNRPIHQMVSSVHKIVVFTHEMKNEVKGEGVKGEKFRYHARR